jgi:hypothetical protein
MMMKQQARRAVGGADSICCCLVCRPGTKKYNAREKTSWKLRKGPLYNLDNLFFRFKTQSRGERRLLGTTRQAKTKNRAPPWEGGKKAEAKAFPRPFALRLFLFV